MTQDAGDHCGLLDGGQEAEAASAPARALEIVRDGEHRVTEIGSYEDGFWENVDNDRLWPIPSVIGFVRR